MRPLLSLSINMTYCSFNRLVKTSHADKARAEGQQNAALHNNRAFFDDWTAARPSKDWPARPDSSSAERAQTGGGTVGLPMVSPAPPLPPEAQREREDVVHVRSLSGDVHGSSDRVQPVSAAPSGPADCRRKHKRVDGPFDGLRVGALETPVQLYDLSRGGCFINSMHQQRPGVTLLMRIDLPDEGWITVTAETVYGRGEFGYAVRFIEISDEASARLERVLQALELRAVHSA